LFTKKSKQKQIGKLDQKTGWQAGCALIWQDEEEVDNIGVFKKCGNISQN
jgi:hypothetical protein